MLSNNLPKVDKIGKDNGEVRLQFLEEINASYFRSWPSKEHFLSLKKNLEKLIRYKKWKLIVFIEEA